MRRTTLPILLAAAALTGADLPAAAATAHNSQAGAWGPNSHQCAATPYFPAGGCVSAAIANDPRSPFDEPAAPYRPGRRLTYPRAPLADPGE